MIVYLPEKSTFFDSLNKAISLYLEPRSIYDSCGIISSIGMFCGGGAHAS